jgi:DNA-binding NtrC family response regulator
MLETVLVVEDEATLRSALSRYLTRAGYAVLQAGTCSEALELMRRPVDLILADVALPDGQGFELADNAARLDRNLPVIIMTADDNIDHAIQAVRHGATDFLLKPFSFDALDRAMSRVIAPRPSFSATDSSQADAWRQRNAPRILGSHASLLRVFGIIERVSDTDITVLVTGESGTGKELVARALHEASDRAAGPFVTVNCAAIPENLLESELFGHAKGAFTGATAARIGRFRSADGGTLFLDEVGELPLSLQAKLLRVLQEKDVTPVGDHRSVKVDVRVVAATNQDLEEMADTGRFREDLLYRLNVIPIQLPPLRKRRSDIPELVRAFIRRTNQRRNRNITGLDDEVLNALVAYHWPGNVRQLENAIERMVVLRSTGRLTLEDLPTRIRASQLEARDTHGEPVLPDDGIDLKDALEEFENALILQALERTGWNKKQAAHILRMNRTTLVEKLKKKKLEEPRVS